MRIQLMLRYFRTALDDRCRQASLASGLVWAAIAWAVAYSVSTVNSSATDALRTFAGGMVAAPLIGLVMGQISRHFSSYSTHRRAAVSLVGLYLSAYLFLLATGVPHLITAVLAGTDLFAVRPGAAPVAYRLLIQDPLLGSIVGLTLSGYVLVLWPLSYLNHRLVGAVSGGSS